MDDNMMIEEFRPTPDRSSVLADMFFREHQNEVPIRGADIDDRTVTNERATRHYVQPPWLEDQLRLIRELIPESLAVPAHIMRPGGGPHPDVDPNNPDDEGFVPVTNERGEH